MSLLRVDASIMPATSASRALGDIVQDAWVAAHPDSGVVTRDIGTEPVDAALWAGAVTGAYVPEHARTQSQRDGLELAASLADELIDAEGLLFTVPLYNFGVSQHFKSWFDLAYTDPRIGPAGTALNGKPAVLVTVLGGNYSPGTPKAGWDHSTPWLRRVLEDVWGLDLTIVQREFTLVGVNPALDAFTDQAADLKSGAEAGARTAGESLAAARALRDAA